MVNVGNMPVPWSIWVVVNMVNGLLAENYRREIKDLELGWFKSVVKYLHGVGFQTLDEQ